VSCSVAYGGGCTLTATWCICPPSKPRCSGLSWPEMGGGGLPPCAGGSNVGSDLDADRCPLDRLLGGLHRRLAPSSLSPAPLFRAGDTAYLFGSLPEVDVTPHARRT